MFHVGKRCEKLCLDHQDDVVYNSHLWMNLLASMLEALFVGPFAQPSSLPSILDPPWTRADLMQAIKRLKFNKASDDCGLTAELLKAVPEEYLIAMLDVFNSVLRTGQIPASWKLHSIQTSDFRPIANIRLFYLYAFSSHRKYLGTGAA